MNRNNQHSQAMTNSLPTGSIKKWKTIKKFLLNIKLTTCSLSILNLVKIREVKEKFLYKEFISPFLKKKKIRSEQKTGFSTY